MSPDIAAEAEAELHALLRWWRESLPDEVHGGFYGEIGLDGLPVAGAPKSVILNLRLLWFFSVMRETGLARRAADYVTQHFLTPEGLCWLVDYQGQVIDSTLYAHAQGYGIYAFAEYYLATGDTAVLEMARRLAEIRRDGEGYRDHAEDTSGRLTLGAHLHLLEGLMRLHAVAPDTASELALRHALTVFLDRFAMHGHVPIVCDADWTRLPGPISHGHDAEAGWLIWEAACVLNDPGLAERARPLTLAFAETTLTVRTEDGSLPFQTRDGVTDHDGEWWSQTEALILFATAWQMTGDARWLEAVEQLWTCVKAKFGAGSGGPWTWYATDSGRADPYLAGLWKCPFHTGRAMLELGKRLSK